MKVNNWDTRSADSCKLSELWALITVMIADVMRIAKSGTEGDS